MSETRGGIAIFGMHRSGTSATSQLVSALGLRTAPVSELIKADKDNEHGYFEPERFIAVNDVILKRVGGSWRAPPSRNAVRRSRQWDIPRRNASELARLLPSSGWFWKDPRLSLTLHLWRPWLSDLRGCILCVRHPLAVADSLAVRDGLSIDHSVALWERYTSQAWYQIEGRPAFVMHYEELVRAPNETIEALAEFLGEVGVIAPGNEVLRAVARDAVQLSSVRSHADPVKTGDATNVEHAISTYTDLVRHSGAHRTVTFARPEESADSRVLLANALRETRMAMSVNTRLRARIPPSLHACADLYRAGRSQSTKRANGSTPSSS